MDQEEPILNQERDQEQKSAITQAKGIYQVELIQIRVVKRGLQVLPWLAIAVVIAGLIARELPEIYWPDTDLIMYSTAILAAILALMIFQLLARRTPSTFDVIWKRNLIGLRSESTQPVTSDSESHPSSVQQSTLLLEEWYQSFLHKVEAWLNHPAQWISGGIFALLVFAWIPNAIEVAISALRYLQFHFWGGLTILLQVIIQFLLSFWIGLLVWRMLLLGISIWRLGKIYEIRPRIGDPDSCGGLEPLGNLCLWNALIISIAGLYLGGWIILAHIPTSETAGSISPWLEQAKGYADIYSWLILIPIALSTMSFLVPLWSIHQAMQARALGVKQEMEQLAQNIAEIEQTLLEQADTLDQGQADSMNKKLKTMQEIYERNKRFPVWPFNLKTLAKFASSQLVPILVALGLSDNVADVLRAILEIFI